MKEREKEKMKKKGYGSWMGKEEEVEEKCGKKNANEKKREKRGKDGRSELIGERRNLIR